MRHFAFAVCCALFLAGPFLVEAAQSDDRNGENGIDAYAKRKQATAVWFGPRLGRRKRNPAEEGVKFTTETEQLGHLLDIIQDTPWAIVAIGEGKRHVSGFTPRLGRDSNEDFIGSSGSLVSGERMSQEQDNSADLMMQRSPPFAPRLGRRQVPFSPRLGRFADRLLV